MFETIVNLKSRYSNFKMVLRIPGLIENAIYIRRGWETGLAEKIVSYIRENSVFVDVGANIGYHTLYVARCYPDIRCICFEPNPSILKDFKRNAEVNQFNNISVFDFAVGDACRLTDFYMTGENSLNRSLSAVSLPKYDAALEKSVVSMITLDDFLENDIKANVSVLKIEAQGYEYQALHGALDLIKKSKPVIFMEFHDESEKSPIEIFNLIPDYEIYTIDAWSGETSKYEKADAKCWSDFLCIPLN